ncbi:6599_t:CDS:1 [Acaulospora morrowiae]|uniref:6599_t:CDS:1 n=1 Tax=Acaulospora morrowiae TaxID=94023 RepID=A0A9N9I874_9GLOM|nr:6599_t:CDS:1 [Acaulospora morrowiae]
MCKHVVLRANGGNFGQDHRKIIKIRTSSASSFKMSFTTSKKLTSQFNCNINLPFPPSITIDEILKRHLRNGVGNVNRTLNAFLIYRIVYNSEVRKLGLSTEDISKLASNSWRNESIHVKSYYREIASGVKSRFREKVPICFINSQGKGSVRERRKITDTPIEEINQIPPVITDSSLSLKNMERNHQNNTDLTFMASLPIDLALTYNALMQSLPL